MAKPTKKKVNSLLATYLYRSHSKWQYHVIDTRMRVKTNAVATWQKNQSLLLNAKTAKQPVFRILYAKLAATTQVVK